MKHMKQLIALLLALVLCLGLLAGCAGKTTDDKSDQTDASTDASTDAPAADTTDTADEPTGNPDGTIVVAETGFEGKFSPFFAASSSDQDAALCRRRCDAGELSDRIRRVVPNGQRAGHPAAGGKVRRLGSRDAGRSAF